MSRCSPDGWCDPSARATGSPARRSLRPGRAGRGSALLHRARGRDVAPPFLTWKFHIMAGKGGAMTGRTNMEGMTHE